MNDRQHRLTYEGRVHVRPVERGIVLEDEPGEPDIQSWLEHWIAHTMPVDAAARRPADAVLWGSGAEARLRISVEWIDTDAERDATT